MILFLNYLMKKYFEFGNIITMISTMILLWNLKTTSRINLLWVTGGIASGKSAFIKIAKDNLKVDIVDCD